MATDKDATTGGEAGGTGVTKKKSCCTPCRAVLICIPVSCLLLGAVFGILVAVLGNPIAWGSPMMSPSTEVLAHGLLLGVRVQPATDTVSTSKAMTKTRRGAEMCVTNTLPGFHIR